MAAVTTKPKKKNYKLSADEKKRMSNRINYFRTLPSQVLKTAPDLETGIRQVDNNYTDHEIRSTLVGGRIMLLNITQ